MNLADKIVFFLAVALFLFIYQRYRRKLPPGPSGWPVFGNLFQVPSTKSFLKYAEWAALYGPIFHFRLFSQDVVVLNNLKAANELMDKRSANYSDRPRQVMAGELIGWDRALAIAPSGQRHRAHRKLINTILSVTAVKRLWPVQEASAHDLIHELFTTYASDKVHPHAWFNILRRRISRSVAGIVYGDPLPDVGMNVNELDQYIVDADEAQAIFVKTSAPFAYLVDSLPWLRYIPDFFPFAGFKREARKARKVLEDLTLHAYIKTRDKIKSGITQASYVDLALAGKSSPTIEEEESIAWTAVSAYTAGSDTTIATLTIVILLAALHTEKQELVHKELLSAVGTERLPCLDDKPSLPYTSAFIEECMRLLPVAPLGVAHKALETDAYEGLAIPKSSTILTNIWSMANDSTVYSTPYTFKPERFLPPLGEPSIGSLPFGFGRRICPGMHLATSGVWIYAACLLHVFRITLPPHPNNRLWTLEDFEFVEGQIRYPAPFEAKLTVRSEDVFRADRH